MVQYFDDGEPAAKDRELRAMIRQHHTDIQRLLKRLPPMAGGQLGENYPGSTGAGSLTGMSQDQRGFQFINSGASTIPAYGVLRITGAGFLAGVGLRFQCDQPDTYGSQWSHAINSGSSVAAGASGWLSFDFPAYAAYDTADGTPVAGQSIGPRNGTWLLRAKTGGFRVISVLDSTNGIALVSQAPLLTVKGKTSGVWTKGTSQSVPVWWGTEGAETSTGVSVFAYNRYGDVQSGKSCRLEWNPDTASFEMVAGEC